MPNIYLRRTLKRPLTFGELDSNFSTLRDSIEELKLVDLADVNPTGLTDQYIMYWDEGDSLFKFKELVSGANLQITYERSTPSVITTNDTNGPFIIKQGGTGNLFTLLAANNSTILNVTNSGYIGINTNSPLGVLHVNGSGTSSTTWTAQFHNSTGVSNTLMLSDSGNVLINSNVDAGYRLDVNGTVRMNGSPGTNESLMINASSAAYRSLAIGTPDRQAIAGGSLSTAVGPSAQTAATYATAYGWGAYADSGGSIVINAINNAPNIVTFGPRQLYATPYDTLIRAVSGSGTNVNGASIFIQGGRPTGNGLSGDVIFSTATTGASGTTLRSLTNRWWIKGETGRLGNIDTPLASLHMQGSGTTLTTWTAQFHNSSGISNTLMIRDDGRIGVGTTSLTHIYNQVGDSYHTLTGTAFFEIKSDGQIRTSFNGATGAHTGSIRINSNSPHYNNSIAIGTVQNPATVTNSSSMAIGPGTSAGNNSIAIGHYSIAPNGNNFVAGGARNAGNAYSIKNVYFGSGIQNSGFDGAGASYTIHGSGAFGTDFAGGNITIAGGRPTGNGLSGDVIFSTATAGASGTTLRNLTDRWAIKGETGHLQALGAFDIVLNSASAHYFGDANVDGTWRFIRNGTDLEVQLRVSGTYVTKGIFTP